MVALVLCLVMASPVFAQTPEIKSGDSKGFLYGITKNYRARNVPAIGWEDSPRIDRLIRAGRIYLSLRDAIALALENNLDLEVARVGPKLSDAFSIGFEGAPDYDETSYAPARANFCAT